MNEELKSFAYEATPKIITDPRGMGRNALHAVNEVDHSTNYREDTEMNQEHTVERGDGAVYAQDQEKYKPFAAEATSIIKAAVSGDLEALGSISSAEVREALHARIESHGGNVPSDEIEKMISVACGALARSAYGEDFDEAA